MDAVGSPVTPLPADFTQLTTLRARIEAAATDRGPFGATRTVTFVSGDEHETLSWRELHEDARSMAAELQRRGITPGSHVAILGPTTRTLVTAIQATWLCGGCVVMLPLPMRMASLERFVEATRDRIRQADSAIVLIDSQLAEFVSPVEGDPPMVELGELLPEDRSLRRDPGEYVAPADEPDSLAILQFTSGSTSEPKGVMLTNRAVCANLDGAIEAAEVHADEVVVSWLPLYHDMGLVGLLCIPMTTGVRLVLGAPQDFLAKPARWMQWMSDFGGTATAGPNFSYVLATRALRRAADLDLSKFRVALNGAEPVDADSFREFAAAGAPFGMRPDCLFPAFGMAELCIAGCFPAPGQGMRTDVVDSRVLEHERFAASAAPGSETARELAVLGRPIPGLAIRIVDPQTGRLCRDREVGELQIKGTSVTAGYYENPESTAEAIVDGWLRTGDLAYTIDGEMVMCGRIKDVIIIGGRNVYPQDIEKVVGEVEGVRKGNVIAFGQEGRAGKQHIVVVAETRLEETDDLEAEIRHRVTAEIGVPAHEVVLVPPATIPKTSSGKLQRSACGASYQAGEYRSSKPARHQPERV